MSRIKLLLATLGVALAVVALYFDDKRFTWVAIGVLCAALLLRLVTRRKNLTDE